MRKKRGDKRCYRLQITQVAIHFRGDSSRVKVGTAIALQKARQMSEPHSSGHAFAGDISKHGKNLGTILREGGKVPGEKARGEDLAGKLQVAAAQHTWAAEFALDLHGVEQLCMEINSLSQE